MLSHIRRRRDLKRSRPVSGFDRLRGFFVLGFVASVAACSGINMPTTDDLIPQAPKFELKTLPPSRPIRPLGAPSLIGPDGSCSTPGTESEFVGGGIGLDMSECDVVQRAGAPDNIDISTNPRGDRAVVLTYARGERPGIYRFAAGRLFSIERGPEPPAPERPAKKKAKTKSG
jgi:hypothetical protein